MDTPTASSELVTYAARLVRVVARRVVSDSPSTLRMLSQLDELGPVTVTELSRADRTSQPTTSAAVRNLEEKGLVTRIAKPGDARSTLIGLTDAGRAELTSARDRHARVIAELVTERALDEHDVEVAVAVLRTLTERPC